MYRDCASKIHAMTKIEIALSMALAVACMRTPTAAQTVKDSLAEEIDKLAQPLIEHKITVGLVVGVLRNGKTVVRGHGRVAKDGNTVPNGDTVYEIGSISKVFTGILLADTVQRKLLRLDDPVQEHLPQEAQMPTFRDKPVRLIHLTTHTSAFPRMPLNFRPGDKGNPFADYGVELLYKGLPQITLKRAPGSRYQYSNLAVGLLGHVLTLVNKKAKYEELLIERITQPLGLSDTRVTLSESMQKRLAPPYAENAQPRKNWDLNVLVGAGGIRSTANDMLRFAVQHFDPKDDDIHKALRMAWIPHYKPKPRGGMSNEPRMGLGWHLGTALRDVVRHNGATGGYRAFFAIHKKRKIAVVAFANSRSTKLDELGRKVLLLSLGRKVRPLGIRKELAVDRAILERYVGEYLLPPKRKFEITLNDAGLHAQLSGQPVFRIYASSKNRFFYRVVRAEIEFKMDANGKTTSLVLHQNGKHAATKVK